MKEIKVKQALELIDEADKLYNEKGRINQNLEDEDDKVGFRTYLIEYYAKYHTWFK